MIKRLVRDLEATWGYTLDELLDIEEKMEEIAHEYYWQGFKDGHQDNLPKVEQQYGRREDQGD